MQNDSDERRQHERYKVKCSIALFGKDGQLLVNADTTDLSEGGAYVSVERDIVPDEENVNVTLSIPQAPEEEQIEGFAADAKVLRRDPCDDGEKLGLALQFTRRMHLPLEK